MASDNSLKNVHQWRRVREKSIELMNVTATSTNTAARRA